MCSFFPCKMFGSGACLLFDGPLPFLCREKYMTDEWKVFVSLQYDLCFYQDKTFKVSV